MSIRKAIREGNRIYNVEHPYTHEQVILEITDNYWGKSDIKHDGYLYFEITKDHLKTEQEIEAGIPIFAKVVLGNSFVTPEYFGAVGDAKADDTVALNIFFKYIFDNPVGTVKIDKKYKVTDTIQWGNGTRGSATLSVIGSPKFICNNHSISTVLNIWGFQWGVWDGLITVNGVGSNNYTSRYQSALIYFRRSGRSRFGGFILNNSTYAGLLIDGDHGNTSNMSLGKIRGANIGSGSTRIGYSVRAIITEVTYDSESDATIIKTSDMPRVHYQGDRIVGRTNCMFKMLDEDLMYLSDGFDPRENLLNFSGNRVDEFTAIKDANREFVFITGGTVVIRGSDAGIIKIDEIDSMNTGCAVDNMALYGPIIGTLVAQSSGTSIILGVRPSSASVTCTVEAIYVEGVYYDLIRVSSAVSDGGFLIKGEYAFHFRNCYNLSGGDKRSMGGIAFIKNGRFYEKKHSTNNYNGSRYALTVNSENHLSFNKDSWVFDIGYSKDVYDAYGYTSSTMLLYGSGINNAPTGTFKFQKFSKWEYGNGISKKITINGKEEDFLLSGNFNAPILLGLTYDGKNNVDITIISGGTGEPESDLRNIITYDGTGYSKYDSIINSWNSKYPHLPITTLNEKTVLLTGEGNVTVDLGTNATNIETTFIKDNNVGSIKFSRVDNPDNIVLNDKGDVAYWRRLGNINELFSLNKTINNILKQIKEMTDEQKQELKTALGIA